MQLIIGDGGNREKLYTTFADVPRKNAPDPRTRTLHLCARAPLLATRVYPINGVALASDAVHWGTCSPPPSGFAERMSLTGQRGLCLSPLKILGQESSILLLVEKGSTKAGALCEDRFSLHLVSSQLPEADRELPLFPERVLLLQQPGRWSAFARFNADKEEVSRLKSDLAASLSEY